MIPNGFPPNPHPRRQKKCPAQRANKLEEKKHMFDVFPSFVLKRLKRTAFVRYCLMSIGFLTKTIVTFFPRGSKKRKSNNDVKHGHGQEKRRPSTLCWEKNVYIYKSADLLACESSFHFSFPSTLCLLYAFTNSFLFGSTPLLVRFSVRIYVVVVEG